MTGVAFELGINYWPRRKAMYMWRELDLAEVRDEMLHIADMGFARMGGTHGLGPSSWRAGCTRENRGAPSVAHDDQPHARG